MLIQIADQIFINLEKIISTEPDLGGGLRVFWQDGQSSVFNTKDAQIILNALSSATGSIHRQIPVKKVFGKQTKPTEPTGQ